MRSKIDSKFKNLLSIFLIFEPYLSCLGNVMIDKTTEEFQQEILKNIKLKNTSVDIYYQQNVVLQFQI